MKKSLFALLVFLVSLPAALCQNTASADMLQKHVMVLASDSLSGRGFGFPEKQLAVSYITGQFSLAGFKPLNENYIHSFSHIQGLFMTEGMNIIGVIEGKDPVLKNEYIVLGAHYDHMGWKSIRELKVIFNGADDNASGVASIIEIGKRLKNTGLKRSIIIAAFDGEEAGLLGSNAFVTDTLTDISAIKAMFSLDMVGMLSKNNGIDLDGIGSVRNGKELATKTAEQVNLKIRKTGRSIETNTDTWPFALKSIPAVHVFTGLKSPYHKPQDDADLLDYEGMSSVASFMTSLVTDMANMDNIDADTRFITRATNPVVLIGWNVNLGKSHFYSKEAFYDNKSVFAIEAGLAAKIKMSRFISLQPGIMYERTGSQTQYGKLQLNSVTPHIDLLLTTPATDISRPVSFLGFGGYYRYHFAASLEGNSFDFEEQYFKTEAGLRAGLGIQYRKTQLSYMLEYGLDNVSKITADGDIYSRGGYISVIRYF